MAKKERKKSPSMSKQNVTGLPTVLGTTEISVEPHSICRQSCLYSAHCNVNLFREALGQADWANNNNRFKPYLKLPNNPTAAQIGGIE